MTTSPWTTCLAFLLFIFTLLLPTPTSPSPSPPPNGICQRKYLRNEPFYLESLRGCRVIEGSLQLAMMNPTTNQPHSSSPSPRPPSTWDNYTFPELREITGYLLVFEVYNLTSLSKLFPNLAVIRGQELVDTHALVINSGQQLQEIGLPSLTDIQRGSVWIVDNSQLCYVDTLDWSLITNESSSDGISNNKQSNHCPNVCHKSCQSSESDPNRQLCWGSAPSQCQKVFKTFCPLCHGRPCTDKGECCSPQCLGGCSGTGPRDCYVCKHVIFNGTCTEECPPGFYEYLSRRCVTRDECLRIQAAPDVSKGGTALLQGKLYENHGKKQCILECPKDTELAPNKKACVPCNGACKKNCPGIQVDSVEKARELAGCTRITGVLKISIRRSTSVTTATIVKELKQNLDKIEEIDDYLVITHTYALFSLDFLENLRVIHGKNLEDSRYALVVRSNENLMELWEGQGLSQRSKVTISNKDARILFHYNPKLCPRKIWEFVGSSGIKSPKDDKIDIGITNGDKVTCNTHILNVEIEKKTNNSVLIRYENFRRNLTLTSHLLSYEIHYKEAVQFPGKNVSKYDDRDPCGDDDWTVLEYPKISDADVRGGIQNEPAWEHSRLIANLKHYAWYALYVKTIVIPDENSLNNNTGAESDIIYFQTLPGVPSKPVEVKAASSGPDKISLSWGLPVNPNGELDKFLIWIEPVFENQAFLDQRNYCEKGRVSSAKQQPSLTPTVGPGGKSTQSPLVGFPGFGGSDVTLSKAGNDCCSCSAMGGGGGAGGPGGGGKTTPPSIEDIHYKDHMTNQIFNLVFIAQPDNQRTSGQDNQGQGQGGQGSESNSLRLRRSINLQQDEAGDNSGEKGGQDKLFPGETTNQGGQDLPRVPPEMRVVKEIRVVEGERKYTYTLRNLTHFTTYKVAIQACRKVEKDNGTASEMGGDQNDTRTCSELAQDRVQTAESPSADNIDPNSITTNVTEGNVLHVSWGEPKRPNGVILGYWVKVQRVDGGYPMSKCLTRMTFEKMRNFTWPEGLGPGNYSVRIQVASLARDGEWTRDVYFLVRDTGDGGGFGGGLWAIVVLLPLMVMIGVGGFLAWFYIRQKDIGVRRIISANPEYMSNVDIPEEWEVPRDKLCILDNELGQGSFGTVYEGLLKDFIHGIPVKRCAVKTVSDDTPSEERALFLREAALMVKLDCHCHHVVKLLGVVSKTQPTYVVMELMTNGDLKNYLRSRRPGTCNNGEPPPTLRQILRMAAEIADGMSYIHKHKLVHRDLAARNCMVGDDTVVKVGDFGMTKEVIQSDYYRKQTRGLLPVRWMAPESLKDGVFTNQTDVWSFGVVLWEMATLAAQPYQGLSNAQVLDYVVSGRTMERPENCPDILFELMIWCWQVEPRHRPNFIQIIERLSPDLDPSFAQCSFFHSAEGQAFQETLRLQSKDDALIEIRFDSLTPLATLDDDLDDDLDDYSTDEETALHSHAHHYPHRSLIDDTSATRLLSTSPPAQILPSNLRTSSTTSTLLPLNPLVIPSPQKNPHQPSPPSKKSSHLPNHHLHSSASSGEDVHLLLNHNSSISPTSPSPPNHPPSPSSHCRPRTNSNNNNTNPRLPPGGSTAANHHSGSSSSINYPSIPNGIGGDSSSPWESSLQSPPATSPKCSLQQNNKSSSSPAKQKNNSTSSTENSQALMINFTPDGSGDTLPPPSTKISNGSNGGGGGVGGAREGVPGTTGGNGYIIRRTSPLHHNSVDKQPQPVNRTTQC